MAEPVFKPLVKKKNPNNVTLYLPKDLAEFARSNNINLSRTLRNALIEALTPLGYLPPEQQDKPTIRL